jgi:hypothetical protein
MVKGIEPKEEYYDLEDEEEEVLPDPSIENLSYIAREIRPDLLSPNKIQKILEILMANKGYYIKQLGDLFESEEKILEKEKKSDITRNTDVTEFYLPEGKTHFYENLSLIFSIFKNIFIIADQQLIETLISDELYLITFGALECNSTS